MTYEQLMQRERDLTDAIRILVKLSNDVSQTSAGGFSKLYHAELHLRTAVSLLMAAEVSA